MFLRGNARTCGLGRGGGAAGHLRRRARTRGAIVGVAAHNPTATSSCRGASTSSATLARDGGRAQRARRCAGCADRARTWSPRARRSGRRSRGHAARQQRGSAGAARSPSCACRRRSPTAAGICRHPVAEDRSRPRPLGLRLRGRGARRRAVTPEEERRALAEFVPSPTRWWVLDVDGKAVARSIGSPPRLPDAVQIGGVYTPPQLRGRGYARAVVAGSLLDARAPRRHAGRPVHREPRGARGATTRSASASSATTRW